ncbi:MAG: hypothetical protein WCJ14_07435 [Verrucomicrobiota bacterium]
MIAKAVVAFLITSTLLQAAPRLRNSSDSQRAIQQGFIQRDATTVTLRLPNGKPVTTPIDQLSAEDRAWLNQTHPLPGTALPPQTAVFDQLLFGDTRAQVLAKLKASKFVELAMDETFIGRTGLNGVFRTRKKIGGLNAALYFDWTPAGELKELTLQTETLPARDYRSVLLPSWQEFIPLLTTLYGKPVQKGSFPGIDSIADGTLSPSHLWALEGVGSALLGAARDGDKYQVVVRFTQKQIQPAYLPDPPPGI